MPPAKDLSAEEERQMLAAREGGETVAEVLKRFGIGTTRLYKIWGEGGKTDPKPPALENQDEEARGAQEEENDLDDPFLEFLGLFSQDLHAMSLHQEKIGEQLQKIAEHLARKDGGEERILAPWRK